MSGNYNLLHEKLAVSLKIPSYTSIFTVLMLYNSDSIKKSNFVTELTRGQ